MMEDMEDNHNHPLSPIIKWPGGKEKGLKYILPELPEFDRYFEPFVGGRSVFGAVDARQYFINDLSWELAALYRNDKKAVHLLITNY